MKTQIVLQFLLAMFGTFVAFEFTPQEHRTGLTFVNLSKARISYDTYTMLYYLEISEYKNLANLISEFIVKSEEYCNELATDLYNHSNKSCKIMIEQLTTQLKHVERDELDIEAYQQKTKHNKRSLEVVGNFLHWAFGLMDADTARQYDEKIDQIHNNSSRLHHLVHQQTMLIKEQINVNNNSIKNLEFQITKMKDFVNTYLDYINGEAHFKAVVIFTEGVTIAKLLIMEHQRLSQQILHCLENVISGKITQLIPKDKLLNDLRIVESKLEENQKLPINFSFENPLHIFKYSKIATSLYGNRLFMEINIPLVERDIYTAYKIIPIPTTINGNTVIINPSTNYVLINDGVKEYIPITMKEYKDSEINLRGEKIIKPAENSRFEYLENCEVSIFMNPTKRTLEKHCDFKIIPTSNYFIPINSNNQYYLTVNKPIIITEYCRGKSSTIREINENGLLIIEKECRVTTDKISLRPRTNYAFESNEIISLIKRTQNMTFDSILNSLKILSNFTIPHFDDNILIQDYSSDFNNLAEKANKLIEDENTNIKWITIRNENIETTRKSYMLTIFIGLSLLALLAFVTWYLYSRFFSINTWVKLANTLGKHSDIIPKMFVKTINTDTLKDMAHDINSDTKTKIVDTDV